MTMKPQDEQAVNPASPEFFFEAETACAEASAKIMGLMADRWRNQQAQSLARDTLKDIEARQLISGQVEGKNAEERKAQLAILLAEDAEYIGAGNALRQVEATLFQIEIDMESARSLQSLMRYRLRYADATLRYLANIPPESPHESEAG